MQASDPEAPVSLKQAAARPPGSEVKVLVQLAGLGQAYAQRGDPYLNLRLVDASGELEARVWSSSEAFRGGQGLEPGAALVVWAEVESYRGAPRLVASRLAPTQLSSEARRLWVFGEEAADAQAFAGKVLGFDIETTPLGPPEELPPSLSRRLEGHARTALGRDAVPVSEEALGERMRLEQALNPLLGRVVSVALADAEASLARVLVAAPAPREPTEAPEGAELRFVNEAQLLAYFWHISRYAGLLVSFNGEDFDLPFLEIRSRILGVAGAGPGRDRHADLRKLLRPGRGHLGSLELCCHAFGIQGPKGEHTGADVGMLYAERRYTELASYNLGDVRATLELWRRAAAPEP
jgi:hypothetical protein